MTIHSANENENGPGIVGSDAIVTNNVVIGTRNGFGYLNYQQGGGLQNVLIAGNTFVNTLSSALFVAPDTHQNSTIVDNIFAQLSAGSTSPLADVPSGSGITYGHNLFWGGAAGNASGSGDVSGDPGFGTANPYQANTYRPSASSPVVSAGAPSMALTVDYAGVARTSPPDIGALQH